MKPPDELAIPIEPFRRLALLDGVRACIDRHESLALWAPRYSGRTTFLRQLEEHYLQPHSLPVYTLPSLHLDASSRGRLFETLAQHIDAAHNSGDREQPLAARSRGFWDNPASFRDFLASFLGRTGLRQLILILDDCDQLLSNALIDLLRALRDIQAHRRTRELSLLQHFVVVVAGAVSFRNLKLLDRAELSPFDNWPSFRIDDLAPHEAAAYLFAACRGLGRTLDSEAQEFLVDYGGGDLHRLNVFVRSVIESTPGLGIAGRDCRQVVERLLSAYSAEPSTCYMISVIRHDPRCLDVLARLARGLAAFQRKDVDSDHARYFGTTNQELSGGFLLERSTDGRPLAWRFRNRYVAEVLQRHFDPATMMRAYLDLSRPPESRLFAAALERDLARSYQRDILSFDEGALRDLIEARWEQVALSEGKTPVRSATTGETTRGRAPRRAPRDRIEDAFSLMAELLSSIFGIEEAALYEMAPGDNWLTPLTDLPEPPFSVATTDAIARDDPRAREARAARSKMYSVEIETSDYLRIVIPLRNHRDDSTGVISLRVRHEYGPWATLFVRIPIIERALNFLWRRLSRIEDERRTLLEQAAQLGPREPGSSPSGTLPVFVVMEFEDKLRSSLERKLRRLPDVVKCRFIEPGPGSVLTRLLAGLCEGDPLVLCDMSRVNCNAFLELGLAIGLNRPGIPLVEHGHTALPDLVQALFWHEWRMRGPLGERFHERLSKTWSLYNVQRADENWVHLLDWGYQPAIDQLGRYIVVIGHNEHKDDVAFRKAAELAASRLGLRVEYIWDEAGRLIHHDELEARSVLVRVYTLLRGAQVVLARSENIKASERASHFVAIGIAMGLQERMHDPRVLFCMRETTPEGEACKPPSDLGGVPSTLIPPGPWKTLAGTLEERLALALRSPA
ncbi:MAG TPA: hypothetical protein VF017_23535 [Thermoanaerobaculia bacterium]|nr:hypothetical protein [Thermoanaerobaculia bacterium]